MHIKEINNWEVLFVRYSKPFSNEQRINSNK